MAAIAQLVNCLQSLFLADGDRFIVTPTYHVFAMHQAHQGADSVRTLVSAPRLAHQRDGKPASFWGLNGSASVKDRQVVVTAVNPSTTDPRATEVVLRGAAVSTARATVLTAAAMNAHNAFDAPDVVKPGPLDVRVSGGTATLTIPPMAVVKIELALG